MEKLRKAMRKEDGFTLVELLAVIVILGIILAIAIPAIGNVIEKSRSQADEHEVALIVDAARLYIVGEGQTVPEGGLDIKVQGDLVANGYLENVDDVEGIVNVTRTDEGLVYEFTAGNEAGETASSESEPEED